MTKQSENIGAKIFRVEWVQKGEFDFVSTTSKGMKNLLGEKERARMMFSGSAFAWVV